MYQFVQNFLSYVPLNYYLNWFTVGKVITKITRNSSGDEIANVNFLYDSIVHALQNTIDWCINSATVSVSALEVLYVIALYKSTFTYLLTQIDAVMC